MKLLGVLLLAAALTFWLGSGSERQRAPGEIAPLAPEQTALGDDAPYRYHGYTIQPLAGFALTARVLGRRNYGHDRESALAPVDLALGWGAMSDSSVLDQLKISQGGRWYRWETRGQFPIPRREIETQSANMHLVPATDDIAAQIERVRAGDVITLRGALIEAVGDDKWRWKSSLSRTDTGGGSCELVWVEEFGIQPE